MGWFYIYTIHVHGETGKSLAFGIVKTRKREGKLEINEVNDTLMTNRSEFSIS